MLLGNGPFCAESIDHFFRGSMGHFPGNNGPFPRRRRPRGASVGRDRALAAGKAFSRVAEAPPVCMDTFPAEAWTIFGE